MTKISIEFEAAVDEAVDAINKLDSRFDDLDVTIGDTAEETDRSSQSFTELNSVLDLAQKGVGYLKQAYSAVVTPTLELASAQRELALAGQITVEEAGRLIQVGDDLGIETGTLKAAFREMTKDGLQPTFENIKAVAQKYQEIKDPTERLQFAQQSLGRAYQDMLPFLERTPAELDEMARSAEQAGLVMGQDAVQAARDYEIAIDNLQDSLQGLTVTIGSAAIPAMTDFMNANLLAIQAQQMGAVGIAETSGIYQQFALGIDTDAEAVAYFTQKIDEFIARKEATAEALMNWVDEADRANAVTGALAGNVQSLNEAQAASESAGDKAAGVYREAESALREFNIGMATRLELEQQLALASGQITEDDIIRSEQIGFLTKQLQEGNITQEEWKAKIDEMAAGALTVKTSLDELTPAIAATGDEIENKFLNRAIVLDKTLKTDLPTAIKATNDKIDESKVKYENWYNYLSGVNYIAGETAKSLGGVNSALGGLPNPPGGGAGGGSQQQYQHGGIATGPASGYMASLHGTEAVVPLPNGGSIPVEMRGGGGAGGSIVIQLVADGRLLFESVVNEARAQGVTMVPVS